ncbi:MAG: ATP synthase F1 subunit epsilon [Elusimicrobiota bacterium]
MAKINLTVLTPDRVLISGLEADSLVLPAYGGELGILPGHAPLVAQLKEGILKYKAGGKEEFLSVFWGFAYIEKDKAVILTEMAEMLKEISEERARQEYQRAKDAINMKGADLDLDSAQASLKKAVVRMKLAEIRKNKNI